MDTIQLNLDTAEEMGLKVALAISDGANIPESVKEQCELFEFHFRQEPASLCLPWDEAYQAEKLNLLTLLGNRFDQHPALAYMYFIGACSTNGMEGHCRVDEDEFIAAGFTQERMAEAYIQTMAGYLANFPTTPIVFEVHALFNEMEVWDALWNSVAGLQQVGVAAWWCAERLSLNGQETEPTWPLIQTIAAQTFSVCQTVGNMSLQPYRFSDLSLGLDYGTEDNWIAADSISAFDETLGWLSGKAVHGGQVENIIPFSVLEAWTADLQNSDYQTALADF